MSKVSESVPLECAAGDINMPDRRTVAYPYLAGCGSAKGSCRWIVDL